MPGKQLALMVAMVCIAAGCSAKRELRTMQDNLLLEEKFQSLTNWHCEGSTAGISAAGGVLRLDCSGSKQGGVGAMAFYRHDLPDNIAIEYDLRVQQHDGLLITFVGLRGVNGEDGITGVPPRTGVFNDYVGEKASTRSYHVSVCRYDDKGVHTGVSNWRRNPGLHLMASGTDWCTETGKSYHIRIVKRGGACAIEVDGRPGPGFSDPQTLPGPVPTSGKIGFRAIGAKAIFEIRNLRVTPL